MDIAKEMTREALPIKCLEAVILGMYLYDHKGRGAGLNLLFCWQHFTIQPETKGVITL